LNLHQPHINTRGNMIPVYVLCGHCFTHPATAAAVLLLQDGIGTPRRPQRAMLRAGPSRAREVTPALLLVLHMECSVPCRTSLGRARCRLSRPPTACRGWSRELRCQPPGRPSFVVRWKRRAMAVAGRATGGIVPSRSPASPPSSSTSPQQCLRTKFILCFFVFFWQPPSSQGPSKPSSFRRMITRKRKNFRRTSLALRFPHVICNRKSRYALERI